MAGVIGSIRNIATDAWWIPKTLIVTYLTFLILLNFDYLMAHPSNFIVLGCITAFLYVSYSAILIYRQINSVFPILPGILDFPECVLKGVGNLILLAPPCIIYFYTMKYLIENPFFDEGIQMGIYILVTILFTPFIFIPIVLFGAKGNFFDGYRIDIILKGAGEFILRTIKFVLQSLLVLCFPSWILYLALDAMLGAENSVTFLFIAFVITFSIFIYAVYIADLYDEAIPAIEVKKKKKSKLEKDKIKKLKR